MDIYKVDTKEGCYIARELEGLRRKKKRGKIAVRCNRINNDQVRHFRSLFLMEKGTTNIFNEALAFYMLIDDDSIAFNLVYEECDIIYSLNRNSNWKIIDLEIDDKEFRDEISHTRDKTARRAEATAFLAMFSYSYTYGYSNVFNIEKPKTLYDTISDMIDENNITENELGLDTKIINLISQNTMNKQFVRQFAK